MSKFDKYFSKEATAHITASQSAAGCLEVTVKYDNLYL